MGVLSEVPVYRIEGLGGVATLALGCVCEERNWLLQNGT